MGGLGMNVVLVGLLFKVLGVALAGGGGGGSTGGFSVDLIHRDSPLSPLFDPSKTQTERVMDAFRRSVSRLRRFQRNSISFMGIESTLVPSAGEYLMNLSVGTPPIPVIAITDTGSDLTWTQCHPCDKCYKQVLPLFDPQESSTYANSSCDTSFCLALEKDRSCNEQKQCTFRYNYADGSFVGGNLASETLTLPTTDGTPASFPGFVFGCGHSSGGIFDENSSGIIGLGAGKLSMIPQLESSIKGVFSYCFQPVSADNTSPSRINFGSAGVVSGPGTVSTPLVETKEETNYYHVTLEGFSVGEKRLAYNQSDVEEGNVIVDSGTTYTFIPEKLYVMLEGSVAESIEAGGNINRAKDPNGIFSLCYNTTTSELNTSPIITAHFKDAADVELHPLNTFTRVLEDVVCFTLVSTSDIGVLGNMAQVNFLVGFDLPNKRVSFKPTDCTRL